MTFEHYVIIRVGPTLILIRHKGFAQSQSVEAEIIDYVCLFAEHRNFGKY